VFTGLLLWRLPVKLAVADVAAPRLGPAVSRDTSLGDFERMVFARQALQQDEQLGALNLGVTVRGRVATLWGGIPSEEMARRAESVLRGTAGITIVHNELRVEPRREAKKNLFALPTSPAGESPQTGSLLAPGSLTSLPGDRASESQSGFTPEPTAEKPPEAVRVMPPLVITLRPPPFPDPPPFEERKVVAVATAELTAALRRVQAGDTRFRQIRLEVQDGVVRLSGMVSQPGDMMAFAQLIAKVPGVKHVIMGETRTPQHGALQLP
jgi:osmotically-inducible protein OsmY